MSTPSLRGPWDRARIDRFLVETVVPVRLAAVMGDGFPVVVSLWYRWDGAALWCATHEGARIVRHLRRDDRVAFEIAPESPPYRGVRGQGRAELVAGAGRDTLRQLLERYLGGTDRALARWLLAREGELAVQIRPVRLSTWDYTARMSG